MHVNEKNPRFSNPLMHASSPYLKQHAHNPVFWYPWSEEAIARAKAENKPILLSIGYSTCYWCHVMEREVFENVSIAALMNRTFVNIKVDREEHPQIDEIYMVARQMLTQEGGWPNNVFLTPDLKPFYAGGTYMAEDAYGKPGFARLIEWLNNAWENQNQEILKTANNITEGMKQFLVYCPVEGLHKESIDKQIHSLFEMLNEHSDMQSGGFFQAPKFPHESYLQFLVSYYEATGSQQALDILNRTLSKMAAGGIYDHVSGGFHRYAVDKEWYVPHFEKMLYNQAQLARVYTDAARITSNPFFADIAKSILDFTAGPLTDGNGGFYSGIDAETDGVEGAYYAWSQDELREIFTEDEILVFTRFYALADIPEFPGHKHVNGQALIARKSLDAAAEDHASPYVQVAAITGQLMNKLLAVRNKRKSPRLDDKIIVGWNGLMIDAFAHAGKVFSDADYITQAKKAADFILEHAIDNEGRLHRIYAGGKAQHFATLEDYAFLIKGLISLVRATSDKKILEAAISLAQRTDELFADDEGGYFTTQRNDAMLLRIKTGDDSSIPNANAIMATNLIDLGELSGDAAFAEKGKKLVAYFLEGNDRVLLEYTSMAQAALKYVHPGKAPAATKFDVHAYKSNTPASDEMVVMKAQLYPTDAKAGDACELVITLDIKKGHYLYASTETQPQIVPLQIAVQGEGVELLGMQAPKPVNKEGANPGEIIHAYEGTLHIKADIKLAEASRRPAIKVMARFQPCSGTACFDMQDISITI